MTNLFIIKIANSNTDIQVVFNQFEQVEQLSVLQDNTVKNYPISDMLRMLKLGWDSHPINNK